MESGRMSKFKKSKQKLKIKIPLSKNRSRQISNSNSKTNTIVTKKLTKTSRRVSQESFKISSAMDEKDGRAGSFVDIVHFMTTGESEKLRIE